MWILNIRLLRSRRAWWLGGSAALATIVAAHLYLGWQRQASIHSIVSDARERHSGSAVEVLTDYIESSDVSLDQKNRAIWALGELRDSTALAILEKLEVSEECSHDRFVCQHEVRKALSKVRGETPNPFFWQKLQDA